MENVLIVPGLGNSGPGHWQTWFQTQLPHARRVEQADWNQACLPEWAQKVRTIIDACEQEVWLVAHSFGCLASVAAALARPAGIAGAFLAAPADPDRFHIAHPALAEPLPFPSLVVASNNDPWAAIDTARHWAERWGSRFLDIGAAGHINVDAGFGPWPEGLALFEQLRQKALSASTS